MALRVTFIGSGNAFADGGRSHACIHVSAPGVSLLLDCGGSSLPAIKREVDPEAIDAIAISHLHGDHFAGIPFFILDAQLVSKREKSLLIAGPPGTRQRILEALEVLFPGSSRVQRKFETEFVELEAGSPVQITECTLSAFEVAHASGAPAYALRVDIGGRTIAYSGDTEWTDTLVDSARGADLFVCEAYYFDKKMKYHLDYATLASHRAALDCKRMIVTHMSADMLARLPELGIEAAHDGMVVEL